MTDFSENDVDRNWSQKELNQLSEKDLTKLALLKNIKNILFFGAGAFIVGWLSSSFGSFGTAIGWVAIIIYGLLTLEPSLAFLTTILTIFSPLPDKGWRLIQILISGISSVIFVVYILYIYSSMYELNLQKYIN